MSDVIAEIAYEARNLARQNARDIEQHEDLCAERYAGIHDKIGEIKGMLKWAGGTGFSIIIGLVGFLAVQMFHQNEQQRRDQELRGQAQQQKIELLQQQLSEAQKDRP